MIKVDKHIPMPKDYSPRDKYPFAKMDIGDSFFTEKVKKRSLQSLSSLHGKKLGRKFLVREIDGGLRCWRVK